MDFAGSIAYYRTATAAAPATVATLMSAPTDAQWGTLMEGVNARTVSRTAMQQAFATAKGAELNGAGVLERTANLDAARELGSNHEVARYITKLRAMTDPTGYAQLKLVDIKSIQAKVNAQFSESYIEFYNAGLSQKAAKENAMRVAQKMMDIKMEIHKESFPDSANMIETKVNRKALKARIATDDV